MIDIDKAIGFGWASFLRGVLFGIFLTLSFLPLIIKGAS
jgi:hypothetical protein